MGPPTRSPDDPGATSDVHAELIARIRQVAVQAAARRLIRTPDHTWRPTMGEEAEALGVSLSTYSRWCAGRVIPRDSKLHAALEQANVPLGTQLELLSLRRRAAGQNAGPAEPATPRTLASASAGKDDVVDVVRDPVREGERHARKTPGTRADLVQAPEQTPASTRPSLPAHLAEAADTLAANVFDQWDQAAADRKLDVPPPLPVRWRRTDHPVAGPVDVAVGDPGCSTRFRPLPGMPVATADAARAGDLGDLFALYGSLGSGRIILMGGAGSGKTATAILMLLSALDHRMSLPTAQQAHTPVPILLTAHNWDPRRQALAEWLAEQLAATYGFLRAGRYSTDAPAALVRTGMVALFLDGFDEMEPGLRATALRRIGRERRTFRLVVLTRIDEYAAAVADGHLHGALALELSPIPVSDAVRFLRSHQRDPIQDDDPLQPLIDYLRTHADSPLTRALDSPLTLTLIRDDPHTAAELTSRRFRSREEIEAFLLCRVVPLTYGSEADLAQRWLTFLATRMTAQRRDLAWWELHHWAPAWPRCLATALVGLLATGGIGALVFGPLSGYTVSGNTGARFGLFYGAGMGALFALIAALISEIRVPAPVAGRLKAVNPATGLLIGVAVTMAVGNQSGYLLAWFPGIVAGVLAGRAAVRVRLVNDPSRPWWHRLLPGGHDVVSALSAGLPVGLAYGLTKTPLTGIVAVLVTTFASGLMIIASRPVAGAFLLHDPLSSWRRDRRRGLVMGASAAVPLGLVLGLQNGSAHGLLAGIIAGVGLGTVIVVGCMAGCGDVWRTTMTFAQLWWQGVLPLRVMPFLEDARARGILRTAGPYLQFKHARLQALLAESHDGRTTR